MTGVSLPSRRPPRVYYRSFGAILALLLAAAVGPSPSRAQVEISVHPSMVKGPAGAPVTIVEFSDYQ